MIYFFKKLEQKLIRWKKIIRNISRDKIQGNFYGRWRHNFHLMNFLFKNITQLSGKNIIFPFYHLISDQDCPHIRHLYPVKTIDQFKKELDFFQKHYRSEEHTSELQSRGHLVCRLLL